MKTSLFLPFVYRSRLVVLALAFAGVSLSLAPRASAASIYNYSLDTSALVGQNGSLTFDLIDGDGVQNNTVTVSNLASNGTWVDSSDFTLNDVFFLNQVFRDLTLGTFLSFTLQYTENLAPGGFSDSLAISLLDSTGTQSLVKTSDPFGLDALVAVDLGGAPITAFAGTLRAPGTTSVPDSGSTVLLLALGFGALVAASRKSSALKVAS